MASARRTTIYFDPAVHRALRIKSTATKELARLGTRQDRARVIAAINRLADSPRPVGSETIAGADHPHRIRVGDYRVIYEVLDDVLLITVVKAAHRREVYR